MSEKTLTEVGFWLALAAVAIFIVGLAIGSALVIWLGAAILVAPLIIAVKIDASKRRIPK